MIFLETSIQGVIIIDIDPNNDERGFFSRTFCINEFAKFGIDFNIVQCSISYNKKEGTLRGLHYQCEPYEEAKIVRCTMGKIYDVIVDIRPDSPTRTKWISVELSDDNNRSVYIPKGCAHGFQSISEDAIVYYQMNEFYHPECARGIHHNDPTFKIEWPIKEITISEKDEQLCNYISRSSMI